MTWWWPFLCARSNGVTLYCPLNSTWHWQVSTKNLITWRWPLRAAALRGVLLSLVVHIGSQCCSKVRYWTTLRRPLPAARCDGRVYFRISLKRGQIQIISGGNPILNIGKANCQGGGGKSIPRGGKSTPSPPPPNKPWKESIYSHPSMKGHSGAVQ